MLVIARYPRGRSLGRPSRGDSFILQIPAGLPAGEVTVSVVEVLGDKVRVGIEAPAAVKVFRTEVLTERRRLEAAAGRTA